MNFVVLASSTISFIALANDVVQMGQEICKMYETRKEIPILVLGLPVPGKLTFIRKVNRPESVMDACTHCHCRRLTSRNNPPQSLVRPNTPGTHQPFCLALVIGLPSKAESLRLYTACSLVVRLVSWMKKRYPCTLDRIWICCLLQRTEALS